MDAVAAPAGFRLGSPRRILEKVVFGLDIDPAVRDPTAAESAGPVDGEPIDERSCRKRAFFQWLEDALHWSVRTQRSARLI